jgi:hypothetical protein
VSAAFISVLRGIADTTQLSASAAAAIHLWLRDAEIAVQLGNVGEVARLVGLVTERLAATATPKRMRAIAEVAP